MHINTVYLGLILFIGSSSPRITPSKVDNFSALCSISVGVVQIVVALLMAVPAERAEEIH